MDSAENRFKAAVEAVNDLAERPDDDTLLELYALYKQATEGDVHGERPGFFDFVGAAKYEAWQRLTGMSNREAQEQYADLVDRLSDEAS